MGEVVPCVVAAVSGGLLGTAAGLERLARSIRSVPIGFEMLIVAVCVVGAIGSPTGVRAPAVVVAVAVAVGSRVRAGVVRRHPDLDRTLHIHGFRRADRRRVLARELDRWRLFGESAVLVVAGVALCPGGPAAWVAAAVLVAAVWTRWRGSDSTEPAMADLGNDPVRIVADDGATLEAVVLGLRRAGMTVASSGPPVLFRALAGWTMGLGLDAEHAAWAAQIAARLGAGGLLSEPAPLLDDTAAATLSIARALASPVDVVVLDHPTRHLGASERRRLTRVVAETIGARRLVVVTGDGEDVAGFEAFDHGR